VEINTTPNPTGGMVIDITRSGSLLVRLDSGIVREFTAFQVGELRLKF